jgi:adhesin/invasin
VRRVVIIAFALAACGAPERGPPCAAGTICTVAGTGEQGIGDDGLSAHQTDLYLPVDVARGPDGRMFVVDFNNHRVLAVDEEGIARVVVGTGLIGDGPPGPALQSALLHPSSIAFDREGRMLIAAWHNYRIKRGDLAAGTLEDLVGTGEPGYFGDMVAATSARLDLPSGLAIDGEGRVLLADQGNQVIRRLEPDGTIARFAGRCLVEDCAGDQLPQPCPDSDRAYCGDATRCAASCMAGFAGDGGAALEARFGFSSGATATPSARIAFGPDGALYVADTESHRVRRVDAGGIVTTVAGTGERGVGGDGGRATEARLSSPSDVAVAADGTLYIADAGSSCVRAIDTHGIITTAAGRCGERGLSGDGGPPEDALLDGPLGIDIDPDGLLLIADTHNQRVRMVVPR